MHPDLRVVLSRGINDQAQRVSAAQIGEVLFAATEAGPVNGDTE